MLKNPIYQILNVFFCFKKVIKSVQILGSDFPNSIIHYSWPKTSLGAKNTSCSIIKSVFIKELSVNSDIYPPHKLTRAKYAPFDWYKQKTNNYDFVDTWYTNETLYEFWIIFVTIFLETSLWNLQRQRARRQSLRGQSRWRKSKRFSKMQLKIFRKKKKVANHILFG